MKPGSTPRHRFELPFPATELAVAYVTYTQDEKLVLEKSLPDFTLDGNAVYYRLSQEETLRFKEGRPVRMQFDYRTTSGLRAPSEFFTLTVGKTQKREVI